MANLSSGQVKFRVKKLNADSLVALISEKEGIEKIDVINILSNVICRQYIDSSINLATQAIELSEKLEYQKGLADGYFNTGNVYFLLDSLQPTISNYLKALRICENLGPSEEYGNLSIQLSILNFFTGRFDESADYGKLALQIYEKLNDSAGQSMIYLGMGSVKHQIYQDWDSAIYFTDMALRYLDPVYEQNEAAIIYDEKGLIYFKKLLEFKDTSDYNKALYWFYEALKLPELYCGVKARIYINLGGTYLAFNSKESILKGIEYFQKIEDMADSCFDAYDYKAIISNILGWRKYNEGKYYSAIKLFNKSLEIIEERLTDLSINAYREPVLAYNWKYHHKLYKQSSYQGLYNSYYELGDYKQALEYFALSKDAEEKIYMENNQNLITMLESISEDEKIDKQLTQLTSKNELNVAKVKQSRILLLSLGCIFVVLFLVGVLFIRQNKMKNEHQTVLLGQKLLRSQMNPHFIFNSLANIQEFIWKKDPLTANEYLSSFSKLVRLILENSRSDFVPVEKEISTIENYLNLQKLRFQDKFEYTIDVDPEIDVEDMDIPPMLVQPFIENSIEHGLSQKENTGHVHVRFFLTDDKINIEVKDDGIGFKRSSEFKKGKKSDHQSLAMTITQERLLMHYKKYKRKIDLSISDLTDDNNKVLGAQVLFSIPYKQL